MGLNFSKHVCVAVWCSGQGVVAADEPGSTPGDTAFSVSLYRFFFFCLVFVFSPIFPFGLFFFICTADPRPYHALESIYILSFSPELHFREGTKLVHHRLF